MAGDDPRPLQAELEVALAADDIDTADRALERLQEILPADPLVLLDRARLARQRGDMESALRLYRTLAQERPSWNVLAQLADLELELGKVAEARAHLEQGLARVPGSRYLLARLAQLELAQGSPQRAEELFSGLAARFGSPPYLVNLGIARTLLGRYGDAADAYRQALKLAPDHPLVVLNLADALALEGHSEEAAAFYQRALELVPTGSDDRTDLSIRSLCLAHLGQRVEADLSHDEVRL